MTFREWVASIHDRGRMPMVRIAARLGMKTRALQRKLNGQGLSLADMKRIHRASKGVVVFDDYIAGRRSA